MLSGLARLKLTASAIAPVGLTYAWVAFTQNEMKAVLARAMENGPMGLFRTIIKRWGGASPGKLLKRKYAHTPREAAPNQGTAAHRKRSRSASARRG